MTFVTRCCFIFLYSMLTPSYPYSGSNGRGSGIYQGQVIKGTRPDLRDNIRVSCQPTVHFFWTVGANWSMKSSHTKGLSWNQTQKVLAMIRVCRPKVALYCFFFCLWWSNQKVKTHHNWLFMILEKTIMPASAGKEGLWYQSCFATPVDCGTQVNHVFFFFLNQWCVLQTQSKRTEGSLIPLSITHRACDSGHEMNSRHFHAQTVPNCSDRKNTFKRSPKITGLKWI